MALILATELVTRPRGSAPDSYVVVTMADGHAKRPDQPAGLKG